MLSTVDTITLDPSGAFNAAQSRLFRAPDILVVVRLLDMTGDGTHRIEAKAIDADGVDMGGTFFEYTTAQIDGQTGAGTDDAQKYFNCLEKLLKIDLETINTLATFTIV